MDTLRDVQRFLNIVRKRQNISQAFYEKLMNNPGVPRKIKSQVKMYIRLRKKGGSDEFIFSPDISYKLVKLGNNNCGSYGCVYILENEHASGYALKVFLENNMDIATKFIQNIELLPSKLSKQTLFDLTSFKPDGAGNFLFENCYIMKLLSGTLNEYISGIYNTSNNGTLFPHQALTKNINGILDATYNKIETLNASHVLHGDIKFENILYDKNTGDPFLHDMDGVFIYDNDVCKVYPQYNVLRPIVTLCYVSPFYFYYLSMVVRYFDKPQEGKSYIDLCKASEFSMVQMFWNNMPNSIIERRNNLLKMIVESNGYTESDAVSNSNHNIYIRIIMKFMENNDKQRLEYLIKKSDQFSFGMSCMVAGLNEDNPILKQILMNKGTKHLIESFPSKNNNSFQYKNKKFEGGNMLVNAYPQSITRTKNSFKMQSTQNTNLFSLSDEEKKALATFSNQRIQIWWNSQGELEVEDKSKPIQGPHSLAIIMSPLK